jgi:hypothetical protein
MVRLLADENFDVNIVRGILRRIPGVDIVRVQDVGLTGADDQSVLEWAARDGRVLVTHDVRTVTRYAWERVNEGLVMAGVVEVAMSAGIGVAIDDLVLLLECCEPDEIDGAVLYLPL